MATYRMFIRLAGLGYKRIRLIVRGMEGGRRGFIWLMEEERGPDLSFQIHN